MLLPDGIVRKRREAHEVPGQAHELTFSCYRRLPLLAKDRNIYKAETAWACVEYIHANPVRRGLVSDPLAWRWSSAAWYAGHQDVKLAMDDCPPAPQLK